VRRIAQLRDGFQNLQAARLDVVIVLCQKRAAVAKWLARDPLPFPVLIDDDRSRARSWGAYVPFSYDSINIARPASFVVDTSGIIRYARMSRHQLDPAPLEGILGALPL
jgi:peroxiredoxin